MKGKVQAAALIAALAGCSSAALAGTAFGYSRLGIAVGRLNYDTPLTLAGVRYEDMGYAALDGSYQFAGNFFIGMSSAGLNNSGSDTELTETTSALELGFAFAITPAADLIASVAGLRDEVESCIANVCLKDSDTGRGFAFGARAWLAPALAVGAGYANNDYGQGVSGSSYTMTVTPYFGAGRQHGVSLAYSFDDQNNSLFDIGYAYTFNNPR